MRCSKKMRKLVVFVLFVCVSVFYMAGSASAYVLGPTDPGKWGNPDMGTGATVTWSFMSSGIAIDERSSPPGKPTGFKGFSSALSDFMPIGFEAVIGAAFDAWSAVADITFVEVPDSGDAYNASGASGDIRIGVHVFDGTGGTLAHGYYPPANGDTAAGDIHFDEGDIWDLTDAGTGFNIFRVAAHEIGHAIGLDHVSEIVATALMNPFYTETTPLGLLADDIAGAIALYGTASIEPIPEPSTIVLFGIGILVMIGYGWRRHKLIADCRSDPTRSG